jgi:hypothetical protein
VGDRDNDETCDSRDNCVGVYNPGQPDTDGDGAGDACDLTVLSPLNQTISCADPPPTVTWTPFLYDRFRVLVGADPFFSATKGSGETFLQTTTWTIPFDKWQFICQRAAPNLYIRILGKIAGTTIKEYSSVAVLRVN